jgi:phosphoglycerate dehydrogenase-like enzyme
MPTAWRFLDPLVSGQEFNVVFAGPHFHAGLPTIQQEIDRRKDCQPCLAMDDGQPSTLYKYDNIRLIHAPTEEQLFKQASIAHIALPFMERFTADFFAPTTTPNLRLAIQFGVGLEGIDIEAATKAGVAVSNVPADGTGNAQATSEHAIYLAISLLRQAGHEYPRRFRERSLGGVPLPRTLYKKKVTVVGYGAVGSCLVQYLATMGADVSVVRQRPWDNNAATDIQKANSLNDVLPETQILFLACPLTQETLHIVNDESISKLPEGALVINIARGGLVEYHAMLKALQSGQVGGFASDVGIGHTTKPSEPWDPDDEICKLLNVFFTPHVGGYCDASYDVMSKRIVDAIENVILGKPPPVWVNSP